MTQVLERRIGSTWLITATLDVDDMTGVTSEFVLKRHGETVLTRATGSGITVTDEEAKQILITIAPTTQTSEGVTAGLHEWRLTSTKAGDIVDQGEGILYAKDNP